MQINELKVTVGEVCEGYFNDAEEGVVGYDERLDIRPKYQREFVYLCKENEKYKFWISRHTSGYYGSVDYYHCSIIETDFDKWIEENI